MAAILLKKLPNIGKAVVASNNGAFRQQSRKFNLHEHEAFAMLNENGISTPRFCVAKSPAEAEKVARELLTKNFLVKAQILSDGRGKGRFANGFEGGVHPATSPQQVMNIAQQMLGQWLVTKQSEPIGKICDSVIVAERKFARRKFYFALKLDAKVGGPILVASNQMDVKVDMPPFVVLHDPIDVDKGLTAEQASAAIAKLGIDDHCGQTLKMLLCLYEMFVKNDMLMAEVGPYVEDVCSNFHVLDTKLQFDPSAKFRQKSIFAKRDVRQEDPIDVQMSDLKFNFVELDGSIGVLANGAGLAMATMDLLKHYGGASANFLEIGCDAKANDIKKAFKILASNPLIRTFFVNIFGDITQCDTVIEGVSKAMKELSLTVPVIVRVHGNKSKEASKLIFESKLNVILRDDFGDAALTAVRCADIMKIADNIDLSAAVSMKMSCDCLPAPSSSAFKPSSA